MSNAIQLALSVDDRGSPVIEKVTSKSLGAFDRLKAKSARVTDRMRSALSRVGAGIKGVTRQILSWKTALVGLAVYGLGRVIRAWEELSSKQTLAEEGVKQAMLSMGRYTTVFENQIKRVAAELQGLSTFGDEDILGGAKFLMTYEGITDDLMPRTMKVMTDLAALMGGDLTSAANMLGKASMGMTGELRRVGITVDQETFKLQGFAGMLDAIAQQVGGQAETMRKTDYGSVTAFVNAWNDAKEKVGAIFLKIRGKVAEHFLPMLEEFNLNLQNWVESGAMEQAVEAWATRIIDWIEKLIEKAREFFDDIGEMMDRWSTFKDEVASGWQHITSGDFLKIRPVEGPFVKDTSAPGGTSPYDPWSPQGTTAPATTAPAADTGKSSPWDNFGPPSSTQVQVEQHFHRVMTGHDVSQEVQRELDRIIVRQ